MDSINEIFNELSFDFNKSQILELHSQYKTEGISNVLNGLNDSCYGAYLSENNERKQSIVVFYIHYKKELEGFGLEIPIEYPKADELVFIHSKYISNLDEELDIFNVFNTLQSKRASVLEAIGYTTLNPLNSPKGVLVAASKGIVPILKLDRYEFFREALKPIVSKKGIKIDNYTYLMIDNKSGLFKIGRSQKPKFRERTLQSEKPEIYLLASWKSSKETEKILHKKYALKRKRGEWFKLSISDVDDIRDYMNSL